MFTHRHLVGGFATFRLFWDGSLRGCQDGRTCQPPNALSTVTDFGERCSDLFAVLLHGCTHCLVRPDGLPVSCGGLLYVSKTWHFINWAQAPRCSKYSFCSPNHGNFTGKPGLSCETLLDGLVGSSLVSWWKPRYLSTGSDVGNLGVEYIVLREWRTGGNGGNLSEVATACQDLEP